MIDQLLANPNQILNLIGITFIVGVFVYILVLAVLQVRQIRILQDKVQTDADGGVRIVTYVYLLFQLILFVIAILFM